MLFGDWFEHKAYGLRHEAAALFAPSRRCALRIRLRHESEDPALVVTALQVADGVSTANLPSLVVWLLSSR